MSREGGEEKDDFWERDELVERFAARDPDVRLMALVEEVPEPGSVRVLDLGAAGGRNTVPLAAAGLDVHAVDASAAMVRRTRERVVAILGEREAVRRVRRGRMEDLGRFEDASFDLVVGLGVYHQASSFETWKRAIAETARVLRPGGRLLYASFGPASAPDGRRGTPVSGEPHVFSGFRSGWITLLDEEGVDRELGLRGLIPEVPTETVRVETEKGVRVTVNGLYVREPGPVEPADG